MDLRFILVGARQAVDLRRPSLPLHVDDTCPEWTPPVSPPRLVPRLSTAQGHVYEIVQDRPQYAVRRPSLSTSLDHSNKALDIRSSIFYIPQINLYCQFLF